MKVNRSLFVIVIVLFIYACGNKKIVDSEPLNTADITTPKIDYLHEIKKSPYNFYVSTPEDSSFIGLFSNRSDTIAELWYKQYRLSKSGVDSTKYQLMSSLEWGYIYPDTTLTKEITIGSFQYILFSCSEGYLGNSVLEHNIRFYALNKQNFKYYYLDYIGQYSFKCECLDGEFFNSDNLKEEPLVKDELYTFAKSSELIYQRTDRDEDIYYHMNFEEKWKNDNGADNSYGAGYSVINDTIYSTYYKTNLFELLGIVSSDNLIENVKYKIVNFFRGNIIAYDKDKELYFPVFIESCVLGCNKKIEFEENNILKVCYSEFEDSEYRISLDDIIFDMKQGD